MHMLLLAAAALLAAAPSAAATAAGAAAGAAAGTLQSQEAAGGAAAAAAGDSAVIPRAGDQLALVTTADSAYQDEVLDRCRGMWPERFKHGYAHFSGPMIEEFFFKWWSKRRPPLPQVYLPVGWSTYFFGAARVPPFNVSEVARAKSQVEAVLAGLDKRRSYFSVVHFAGLLAKEAVAIPCDLKLTLFIGGGPEDGAWAPHVTYVPIPLLLKVLNPARRPRKTLVSFAGGFLFWQDPGGLRSEMRDLFQNKSGYAIQERVPDWEALIHGSVFHLCPRGNGPSSYRLYESLQADTIPIYIWDEVKWLAFEDTVDWESIAIVVHRHEMASIPDRINATDIAAMRANVGRVRGQWRYNNTSAYIVARVAASAKQEGLNEYRVNSTQCKSGAADPAAAAAAAAGQGAAVGQAPALSLAEKTLEVDSVLPATAAGDAVSQGASGGSGSRKSGSAGGAGAADDGSGSRGMAKGGAAAQTAGSDANLLGILDQDGGHANGLRDGSTGEPAPDLMHAQQLSNTTACIGGGSRRQHTGGGSALGGMAAAALALLGVCYVCSRAARRRQRRLHSRR